MEEASRIHLLFLKSTNEIDAQDWNNALRSLYTALLEPAIGASSLTRIIVKQFAEINFALKPDMSINEVVYWETFLFSKVAPKDWLNSSLGLAEKITAFPGSPIGNVLPVVCENGVFKPFIITANNWCALCCHQGCTKQCSACRKVYYCSSEHQKLHWTQAHKLDCSAKHNTPIFFDTEVYKKEVTLLEEMNTKTGEGGEEKKKE